MGFEILNSADITPHRLHALLRLVSRLRSPSREDILNLLQPRSLPAVKNQTAAANVYAAARSCNLIAESADNVVVLTLPSELIERAEDYRRHMQNILLGITEEDADNHLLNIYTAWYAVQDERVFRIDRKQFETEFNREIYPQAEIRPFNETKLTGWRLWAAFLGCGWPMPFGNSELLIPDAHDRLLPLLDKFLPEDKHDIPFGDFMVTLAEFCPELDGGVLFERCWRASRGGVDRGNTLSLMLSTALRTLHDRKQIELVLRPDALEKWHLFAASGHELGSLSHIRRRSSK